MNARTIVVLFIVSLLFAGCDHPGPSVDNPEDLTWSVVESPDTGRCYEVVTRESSVGYSGYGFMAMAEIPCD